MENQILFFFSALGAFNGFVLSFYILFLRKKRQLAHIFLGLSILMLSIRVGKSVFMYFNPEISKVILQIGLSACFMIGPFFFFYIKATIDKVDRLKNSWKWHLFSLAGFIVLFGLVFPYATQPHIWIDYLVYIIYGFWLAYLIASGVLLKNAIYSFFTDFKSTSSSEKWLLTAFVGNLSILIFYYSALFRLSRGIYIFGSLAFSVFIYLFLAYLIFNKKMEISALSHQEKYHKKKVNNQEAKDLLAALSKIMKEEKVFKNSDLKLNELADSLNVTSHYLSQVLNDNLGKGFSAFVNEYRIEEAKSYIVTHGHFTLEAIGYEVGFNAPSTFYTAFKKVTGTTPANFKNGLS